MPNFRRAVAPGGTFFFTVVTAGRAPILCSDLARPILRNAVLGVGHRWDFEWTAGVLLPDHQHALWTLPTGDTNYSRRWALIKRDFAEDYLAAGGAERAVTKDHARQRRRRVWQPRFFEHTVRDDDDFIRHMDYIHYNPVKHGYVRCPHAWPYSTFHRWVERGAYDITWNCVCEGRKPPPVNFKWADETDME